MDILRIYLITTHILSAQYAVYRSRSWSANQAGIS